MLCSHPQTSHPIQKKKNIQNSHSNIKNTKPTIFFFKKKTEIDPLSS